MFVDVALYIVYKYWSLYMESLKNIVFYIFKITVDCLGYDYTITNKIVTYRVLKVKFPYSIHFFYWNNQNQDE